MTKFKSPKLFMTMIGCKPKGRHTEQHDIFFGIGDTIADLLPEIFSFWPETKKKLHLDAWRAVTQVNGHQIKLVKRNTRKVSEQDSLHLYFINLGGYVPGVFDELHYKILVVANDISAAISVAKQTVFYQSTGFKGAPSHVDDKYGLDVDELYKVEDLLAPEITNQYFIQIKPLKKQTQEDEIHLGYMTPDRLK